MSWILGGSTEMRARGISDPRLRRRTPDFVSVRSIRLWTPFAPTRKGREGRQDGTLCGFPLGCGDTAGTREGEGRRRGGARTGQADGRALCWSRRWCLFRAKGTEGKENEKTRRCGVEEEHTNTKMPFSRVIGPKASPPAR